MSLRSILDGSGDTQTPPSSKKGSGGLAAMPRAGSASQICPRLASMHQRFSPPQSGDDSKADGTVSQ